MNKKHHLSVVFLASLTVALVGCDRTEKVADPAQTLGASGWSQEEQGAFLKIEQALFPGNPEAVGFNGAVTGSYHGYAQRVGLEALKQGGTSADAAMATALTQIGLGAGAVISYFGIMSVVHYDAAADEVHHLNAGWNAVKGEDDPMSIPGTIAAHGEGLFGSGEPSGRTAMVGGFMRGVEAMNERFGKLPFPRLFEAAIEVAEQGIPFNEQLAGYLEQRKTALSRLRETRAVFTREDGEWYEQGDLFKQPELAKTLKAVAEQGADYMYRGPWAKKLVAAVQDDGGYMTLEDLANYEVIWADPLVAEHSGYEVYANGVPAFGGLHMIEALHLAKAADIRGLGHWSANAESFRRLAELLNNGSITFAQAAMPQLVEQLFPGLDLTPESRLKPETAEQLWARMEAGATLAQWREKGAGHSDTVVAVDRWGNMTAVVHSINSVVWGETGIFVDGVSVGDPAVSQKAIVAKAGPGGRVPDPMELGLLMKDGKPVLAFSSMAMGLHLQTAQSLLNFMDFGMTPKEAVDAPAMLYPKIDLDPDSGVPRQSVRVMKGDFPPEVLEGSSLPYIEIKPEERRFAQGLWVGIALDQETGELRAASPPYANGRALAH